MRHCCRPMMSFLLFLFFSFTPLLAQGMIFQVGNITLNSGENILYSAVISPSGDYAYFGTFTVPGVIVKVALNTLTPVGSLTFNSAENQTSSGVISPSGDYAYFGTDTSPGIIVKVALNNFTRVGSLTLNTGENELYSAVI